MTPHSIQTRIKQTEEHTWADQIKHHNQRITTRIQTLNNKSSQIDVINTNIQDKKRIKIAVVIIRYVLFPLCSAILAAKKAILV